MASETRAGRGFTQWTACIVVAACAAIAACGGAKEAPAPPQVAAPVAQSAVSRFFPLVDGTQWAYEAEEDGTGNKGVFVTRAQAMAGPRFSLVTGQRSRAVEVRAEGIVRVENGLYVLRAPLAQGAEWPGEGGAVVRVAAVDRIVDVPAGKYVGCLDTVEEQPGPGGQPTRRITTTYCPEVGIVTLHAEAWENGQHVGERAVLRSYGKPITIVP
jgi:hypothetical protein